MYQFSYAEILDEDPRKGRDADRLAITRSIELLEIAAGKGVPSREAIDALAFLTRLWTLFIEDLSKPDNALPETLRADIISVGLWLLREAEAIRLEKSRNLRGLIEVSGAIAKGLE